MLEFFTYSHFLNCSLVSLERCISGKHVRYYHQAHINLTAQERSI